MKIYILSRPNFDWGTFQNFLVDEGIDPKVAFTGSNFHFGESLVEAAGRLCYMSYGKGRKTRKEFIDNLIQSGHHSVLEHAVWGILITGISRSCSHELVRHRHFSFSQLSQRFVKQDQEEFVCPAGVAGNPALEAMWRRAVTTAAHAYRDLDTALSADMKLKEHRTVARSVLPNATPTKIVITANCRTWREFIVKRNIDAADPEIHTLAKTIRDVLVVESPMLFGDLPE